MIADLPPYPAMRETDVPWLGEVPEHWTLMPNRALVRRRRALVGDRHSEFQLLSLTKEGVIVRDVASGKGKFSADMGTFQEVRTDDLIFCLFDVPETPRTVGLSRHDGMITGAYTVFECPDSTLAAFVDLFYRAMDDRKLLSPLYSGLRNTIPVSRFLSTKTPVPSPGEQVAIVRFLNYADRRIRRVIRAKLTLIELLNEQGQAAVQHAVLWGLDTAGRVMPPVSDWLENVPEHWDVVRLKNILYPVDERSLTGAETLLSLRRDHGIVVYSEHFSRPPQGATTVGLKIVTPGQIVVNRLQANNGLIFHSEIAGVVSSDYSVFSARAPVNTQYVSAVLRTPYYRAHFRRSATGLGTGTAGFLRLYDDEFLATKIGLPPVQEQERILAFLEASNRKTAAATQAAHDEVTLLRELRARLLADVVTGKFDVRDAAALLPDEADEPEQRDDTAAEEFEIVREHDLESVEP